MYLDGLFAMAQICGFHKLLSSSVMPINLNEFSHPISTPFSEIFEIITVICLWYGWNTVNLVLGIYMDNLLIPNCLKTLVI